MTYTTAERRVVLPEWTMAYLLEYGARAGCDDLASIVAMVISEHRRAGIGISVGTATAAPEASQVPATATPAPQLSTRFKLN